MKTIIEILSLALVLASVIGCQKPLAPTSKTLDSTTQSSTSFARRAEALRRVKERVSAYEEARDHRYLGDQGILARATALNESVLGWANGWKTLGAYVAQASSLPVDEVQAKVEIELVALGDKLAGIGSATAHLQGAIAGARDAMNQAKKIDYSLDGYDTQNGALEAAVSRLDAALGAIDQGAAVQLTHLQEAAPSLAMVVENNLKTRILAANVSHLDQTVHGVEALFASEALLAPFERTVRERYLDFTKYYFNKRVFRAEEENSGLQTDCAKVATQIANSAAAEPYRSEAVTRITATCKAAADKITFLHSAGVSIPKLVAASVMKRQERAKTACEAPTAASIDCQMYQWLGATTAEAIAAMPESNLRALEAAWDALEQDYQAPASL